MVHEGLHDLGLADSLILFLGHLENDDRNDGERSNSNSGIHHDVRVCSLVFNLGGKGNVRNFGSGKVLFEPGSNVIKGAFSLDCKVFINGAEASVELLVHCVNLLPERSDSLSIGFPLRGVHSVEHIVVLGFFIEPVVDELWVEVEGEEDWTIFLERKRHTLHVELVLKVKTIGIVVVEHPGLDFWEHFHQWLASDLSAVDNPSDNGARGAFIKLLTFLEEGKKLIVPVVLVNEFTVCLPVTPGANHSLVEIFVSSGKVCGIDLCLIVVEVDFPFWWREWGDG